MAAQRKLLPSGRWHLQHGPIDIVIGAEGDIAALDEAHKTAWLRFQTILDELVAELPRLKEPVAAGPCPVHGRIARRMWHASAPHRAGFITPMAAVAGAVAEELIGAYARGGIERAWVNNGGDIALYLAPGASVRVGLYADLGRFRPEDARASLAVDGAFLLDSSMPVRGVATSGWRGRSFSLGIADSVTVLAQTAAQADAAATIIANAVDVSHPGIRRRPASAIKDDSDLGERLVTVEVPTLGGALARKALAPASRLARRLREDGVIWGAVMTCQGCVAAEGLAVSRPEAAIQGGPAEPPRALSSLLPAL